ncbi:hypothetical protein SH528x_002980 [Novipirellula sp. SH528]|uniref:hypothetical protein n=1 Tax=Novipirellula sp. SH528 TaxID=3454466 RepID=UPI003FA0699B
MAFDIDKLVASCRTKIQQFAGEHSHETFYRFAIDADMLCLNSIEQFATTLDQYQSGWERRTRQIDSLSDLSEEDKHDEEFGICTAEKYDGLERTDDAVVLQFINNRRSHLRSNGCEYYSEAGIIELRDNTGDWAYQGFADLDRECGFDHELYNAHYHAAMEAGDGHAPQTDYAIAINELVARLQRSDAFDKLKRTDDFAVTWVDHTY